LSDPIDIVFTAPANVLVPPKVTIPSGSSQAEVAVTLLSGAGNAAEVVVRMEARAGGHSSSAELRINVQGGGGVSSEGLYLPPNGQPDGAETVEVRGRKYYRAVKVEKPGMPAVRFVLVWPKNAADKWAPFYLMRFKASNSQYRAF